MRPTPTVTPDYTTRLQEDWRQDQAVYNNSFLIGSKIHRDTSLDTSGLFVTSSNKVNLQYLYDGLVLDIVWLVETVLDWTRPSDTCGHLTSGTSTNKGK